MGTAKTVLITLATLVVMALAGAALVVGGGLYDVAATQQHWQPVYSLLERAMHQSVRLRSRNIEPPPDMALDDPRLLARGAACFRDKCVQCHGAPGVAQQDFGQSMQPLPGPLVDATQRWKPRELYWLTRHGIRMSGMPAWQFHMADEDIWAVVGFLQKLPALTPQQYAQAVMTTASAAADAPSAAPACIRPPSSPASVMRTPDRLRGATALAQYACNACHTIPGIPGSHPQVGPPLAGIGRRSLIAGKLANTPENMVAWLTRTHEIDPRTAMPSLGVSQEDARDMAAYLRTLD